MANFEVKSIFFSISFLEMMLTHLMSLFIICLLNPFGVSLSVSCSFFEQTAHFCCGIRLQIVHAFAGSRSPNIQRK